MWTNAPFAAAYQAQPRRGSAARVVDAPAEQISGSTDMGNVSKLLPSIHPMISIAPPRVALHTQEFAAARRRPTASAACSTAPRRWR